MGCSGSDEYSSPSRTTTKNNDIIEINLKMDNLSKRMTQMQSQGKDITSEEKEMEKLQEKLNKLNRS